MLLTRAVPSVGGGEHLDFAHFFGDSAKMEACLILAHLIRHLFCTFHENSPTTAAVGLSTVPGGYICGRAAAAAAGWPTVGGRPTAVDRGR